MNYVNLEDENCNNEIAIKKIFIDSYNREYSFDKFKKGDLVNHDEPCESPWMFPKKCMQKIHIIMLFTGLVTARGG